MNTVPLKALTDGVFAYVQSTRRVVVLKAFFDDSGTHGAADAITMGGLIAHEDDWSALEIKWQAALDDFGIKKMHMSHCERADKEFKGWSRDRRDLAIARFNAIVLDVPALMVAMAISRKDWASAVETRPALARQFSQPIDFCFTECMRACTKYGRKSAGRSEPVVVTFDSRQESLDVWKPRAEGFKRNFPQKIAGFAFGSMRDVLPLQAADMVAYEAFVFQCERARTGTEPVPRPNLNALVDGIQPKLSYFTSENLVRYSDALTAVGERRRASAEAAIPASTS